MDVKKAAIRKAANLTCSTGEEWIAYQDDGHVWRIGHRRCLEAMRLVGKSGCSDAQCEVQKWSWV